MTLFIKRFKKVMKKDGYFNKDKRRSKIKRKSCFGCGEVSHFIVDCPNPKNKNKSEKKEYGKGKKKYSGEAHLIQEWDSSEESSSDDECVATMAVEAHIIKSSLFEDLTDDEDDSTCFMAKGAKVDSKSNSNDDNDDTLDDNEHENMIKELGKKATSKIMKLMIEIKDKDETPEQQEEFIRLEREKTVGLEKSLSKERKSFKVQEDLLKAKINKILELEESLAKEKEKTAYELLDGKKPNVSYFSVFGSNCFILNKKPKSSKFAPKVDEGFLLGYASNAHGYRVFNNSSEYVEIACDVTFDESNGSQKEQVDLNDADNELPPQQAIESLEIGEMRPQEKNGQGASKDGPNTITAENSGDSGQTCGNSTGSEDSGQISGNSGDADEEALDQDKENEDDDPVQHQPQTPHPKSSLKCKT
ncbi:transcriptional regulator IFH1-like [Panicum hallii]|uniref:transcriptional regulator IFH1-like n=1 Tax=Panicum hallii TaxID=206008 RepID=UPI000DF4D88C|nr:transcriptional regulator IFH1-like [Panicum hallii]